MKQTPSVEPPRLKQIAVMNVGPAASRVTAFVADSLVYIAVARSFRDLCSATDSGSLLFRFDGVSKFELVQRLPVSDSSAVVYYNFNDQHYLAFANGADGSDSALEPQSITVFRSRSGTKLTNCQFSLFQKLPFDNLNDLVAFAFGASGGDKARLSRANLYLAAVNRTVLQVWKQDGVAGFVDTWPLRATGGRAVMPMLMRDANQMDHQSPGRLLLVVGADRRHNCIGSVVYEAVARGATLMPIVFESKFNNDRS